MNRFVVLTILLLIVWSCSRRRVEMITIKGSDTEVNLVMELAESFMAEEPAVSIAVTGGGSGLGIAALLNDKTQIANSSRPLSTDEQTLAHERNIDIRTVIFAVDKIAIIVNKAVPISAITLDQVAKIYAGELADWQALGCPKARISVFGRQNSSGTYVYLRDSVVRKEFSPRIRELNGTAQIIEAVRQDPNGIGYVSVGYIQSLPKQGTTAPIRALLIVDPKTKKTFSPFEAAYRTSAIYPLTRPLYQFLRGKPQGKLRQFIEFELSPRGQQLVRSAGYFPVTPFYKNRYRLNELSL